MSAEMAQLIAQCGGTASRAEIGGTISQRALTQAVRTGLLVRPRRGVYALPGLHAAVDGAHRVSGIASHRSAALLQGWGVLHEPKRPEIIVPRGLRVDTARRKGLDVRFRDLVPGDSIKGMTAPLRTVIDCARDLELPEALAVADSALRAGALTDDDLVTAAMALPRTGRTKALRVLDLASSEAAGPFESGLRALAVESTPDRLWVPQAEVILRDGRVRHADVGDHELRIALEADSHEFHKTRQDIRRDCHRYNEMILAGWIVLRFAWEHVMSDPQWVREVIAWVVRQRQAMAIALVA